MSLLAVLLTACAPSPEDTAAEADAEVGRDAPPPAPDLTSEEAVAAIDVGTRNGLPDPVDLYTVYMGLMALGDDVCPGPGDQLIATVVPRNGCTADSGVFYTGVSMLLTEAEIGAGDPSFVARLIGGDFTITDTAGHTLDFGGQIAWQAQAPGGHRSVAAQALGTFVYPGGSPWLAAGVSAVLDMDIEGSVEGAERLEVSGGLGTEGVDLWFDAFVVDPAVCAVPTGAVEVRDPSGAWWRLDLADRCDGCGTLSYPGRADAEVCVDLTPVYVATVSMLERSP